MTYSRDWTLRVCHIFMTQVSTHAITNKAYNCEGRFIVAYVLNCVL